MYELHALIVKKPYDLKKAKKTAREIFNRKDDRFIRETKNSYRFRNIPKTKFNKFRTKQLNDKLTLIYGQLKSKK